MPGKLYIKTFGCQMNEYDSTKMVDVLHDSLGLELTDSPNAADVLLLNTCSVREKAQEKVFSAARALERTGSAARPDLVIGVGGCVASQEGEAITRRAPYRRSRVRSADSASLAGDDRRGARHAVRAVVDVSFPEIEKFDSLPPPRSRRGYRVRLDHGGLQQVLQFLCRPVHARRRNQPAAR